MALLLAAGNLIFFAWAQGLLSPVLMPPMSSEREPERLSQQVRPELITVLDAKAVVAAQRAEADARSAAAAASAASAAQGPRGAR